jgi:hypothetical protein
MKKELSDGTLILNSTFFMSINKQIGPELICNQCGYTWHIMLKESEHIREYSKGRIVYCQIETRFVRCPDCNDLCVKIKYNGTVQKALHALQKSGENQQ